MTALQAQELMQTYWKLHKANDMPLLASVLEAAELATSEWAELVEAHIATFWQTKAEAHPVALVGSVSEEI